MSSPRCDVVFDFEILKEIFQVFICEIGSVVYDN